MLTVEKIHKYLAGNWYDYRCADKDKITQIINEELNNQDNYRDEDHLMLAVKRRCQAEA